MHSKKGRAEQGLFIAEGAKVVEELMLCTNWVKELFIVEGTSFKWMENTKYPVFYSTEADFKKISTLSTPNTVLAVCNIPEFTVESNELVEELVLVLDGIQDPGNLGTIIRIADWFGISHIICSTDTVDCFNPKVVQATMGSIARVKVNYTHLLELLKSQVENHPATIIYGALLGGENIYKAQLPGKKGFLVLGNESKGISSEVQKIITNSITIPSYAKALNGVTGKQGAESLNVAIAAALLCAEFKRVV